MVSAQFWRPGGPVSEHRTFGDFRHRGIGPAANLHSASPLILGRQEPRGHAAWTRPKPLSLPFLLHYISSTTQLASPLSLAPFIPALLIPARIETLEGEVLAKFRSGTAAVSSHSVLSPLVRALCRIWQCTFFLTQLTF